MPVFLGLPMRLVRGAIRHSLGRTLRQGHQMLHQHKVPWLTSSRMELVRVRRANKKGGRDEDLRT